MQSISVSVTEGDNGETTQASVCVLLTDVQDGLDRDVELRLNTVNGTASGIVVCSMFVPVFRKCIYNTTSLYSSVQEHLTMCHWWTRYYPYLLAVM